MWLHDISCQRNNISALRRQIWQHDPYGMIRMISSRSAPFQDAPEGECPCSKPPRHVSSPRQSSGVRAVRVELSVARGTSMACPH